MLHVRVTEGFHKPRQALGQICKNIRPQSWYEKHRKGMKEDSHTPGKGVALKKCRPINDLMLVDCNLNVQT